MEKRNETKSCFFEKNLKKKNDKSIAKLTKKKKREDANKQKKKLKGRVSKQYHRDI